MMLNRFFAVLFGLLAGFAGIYLIHFINSFIFLPEGFDQSDAAAMEELIANASMGMLLSVLASYAFGSFIGGVVASKINKTIPEVIIVALVLMAAGIMNLIMIQHPTWFWVASIATFPVFAFLGGKMGGMRMQ